MDKVRKPMPLHAARPVKLPADAYVQVEYASMAAGLVAGIGEDRIGYFPDFWKNGDGLEVSFRRVRKEAGG